MSERAAIGIQPRPCQGHPVARCNNRHNTEFATTARMFDIRTLTVRHCCRTSFPSRHERHAHSRARVEFAALPAVPDLPVRIRRPARDRHLRARAARHGTFVRDHAAGDPVERVRLHGGLRTGPADLRADRRRIWPQARARVRARDLHDRLPAVARRTEPRDVRAGALPAGLRNRDHQPAGEGDHHRFVLRPGVDARVHVHVDRVGGWRRSSRR